MIPAKKKKISLLFLLLFIVYYAEIQEFKHVHNINGILITHSHPGSDNHTHTTHEFVLIAYLNVFLTLKALPFYVEEVAPPVLFVLKDTFIIPDTEGIHLRQTSLRAPPILL